jgi:hypothetical protein
VEHPQPNTPTPEEDFHCSWAIGECEMKKKEFLKLTDLNVDIVKGDAARILKKWKSWFRQNRTEGYESKIEKRGSFRIVERKGREIGFGRGLKTVNRRGIGVDSRTVKVIGRSGVSDICIDTALKQAFGLAGDPSVSPPPPKKTNRK